MRAFPGSLVVAGVLCLVSGSLPAQQRGIEFGSDIGAQYETGGSNLLVSVPSAMLRVGFPLGDGRARVEPRIQFQLASGSGTAGIVDGQLALRLGLSNDANRAQPYVLAFPEIAASFGDIGDDSQFGLGGGIGLLIPQGDRLAFRIEGTYSRMFDPAVNLIRGSVGVSLFTR